MTFSLKNRSAAECLGTGLLVATVRRLGHHGRKAGGRSFFVNGQAADKPGPSNVTIEPRPVAV